MGRRPAGKKGEGKTPYTHQVMGSNPWEVVSPKMGNPGGDFGLVGSRKGPDTEGSKQKKDWRESFHRKKNMEYLC